MDLSKIWGLVKPVIVVTLAVFGYFFAQTFFTRNLFLAIAILSLLFRGASIIAGFVEIYKAIRGKKE